MTTEELGACATTPGLAGLKPALVWGGADAVVEAGDSWLKLAVTGREPLRFRGEHFAGLAVSMAQLSRQIAANTYAEHRLGGVDIGWNGSQAVIYDGEGNFLGGLPGGAIHDIADWLATACGTPRATRDGLTVRPDGRTMVLCGDAGTTLRFDCSQSFRTFLLAAVGHCAALKGVVTLEFNGGRITLTELTNHWFSLETDAASDVHVTRTTLVTMAAACR